jgi:hypothetical protein
MYVGRRLGDMGTSFSFECRDQYHTLDYLLFGLLPGFLMDAFHIQGAEAAMSTERYTTAIIFYLYQNRSGHILQVGETLVELP